MDYEMGLLVLDGIIISIMGSLTHRYNPYYNL